MADRAGPLNKPGDVVIGHDVWLATDAMILSGVTIGDGATVMARAVVTTAPVLLVFEAKRDSIPDGLGQCIAGMVGAQRFNQRSNRPAEPIDGCVTTGTAWKFLRLEGTALTLDWIEYTLDTAASILGILMHMIGRPPVPAAA